LRVQADFPVIFKIARSSHPIVTCANPLGVYAVDENNSSGFPLTLTVWPPAHQTIAPTERAYTMLSIDEWKRKLKRIGYPAIPRADRYSTSALAAWHGESASSKPATVKDISATGVYLPTEERWPLGESVSLTLQGEGLPEIRSELQVVVEAKVTRHGDDGIGLSFLLPAGLDTNLWGVLVRNAIALTDAHDVLFTYKTLRTIIFLCRLCQSGAEEAMLLLGGQLEEARLQSLLDIALGAEKLLASKSDADKMRAHPKTVKKILSDGSWASDNPTKQLWAGLLASSCSEEGTDDSSQSFADLLVQVTPVQARIFTAACAKAIKLTPKNGELPSRSVVFMPEKMIQITGIYDIPRIGMEVAYLFHHGLIEKNFDFTSYSQMDRFIITPTSLGMEMYKRCNWQ